MAVTYNTGSITLPHIYRATGGGVTFSANLTNTAVFDYFTDTAVLNDAIYFGNTGTYPLFSDLNVNVGTAMVGTGITLAWEYWGGPSTSAWVAIEKLQDDTVSFTATGARIVRFPIQLDHPTTTVNAVSALWVRCRISAITTITEGGANQTTAVTASDGKMNVDSYTDETPCTWTTCYDYMTANYPYVGVVKNGNYFDFRRVIPKINSRLLSKNETIEMCPSCKAGGSTPRTGITLDYLTNGEVSSSDATRGINGSTYIMNGVINAYPFEWGNNHFSYDTEWRNPTIYTAGVAGYIGYPTPKGTFLDCKIQAVPGSPASTAIIKNCRFVMASGFIATSWPCTNFLNNTMMVVGSAGSIFNIYTDGFTVSNLGFVFSSTGNIFRFNGTPTDGQVYKLINPLSPLPGNVAGSPQTITTSPGAIASFVNVFLYDDSAATYTTYKTAASNATTGDVPIYGDVNDCLYMNFTGASSGYCVKITSTLGGTNDYVYAFEYYSALGWTTPVETWDNSNNFTQSGFFFPRKDQTMTTTTINGVNSYWGRFRIVTKGTGTPAIDKIQRATFSGMSHWTVAEQFTAQLTIIDDQGNPIEGASLSMVDVLGDEQSVGTTDENGDVTSDAVTTREYYFDPEDVTANATTFVVEKVFNPYTITISKSGYKTYKTVMTLQSQFATTITLSKVKDLNFSKTVKMVTQ